MDECAPRAFKKLAIDHGHVCRTVQEEDRDGKHNGELLSLAEAALDVLVTVHTNLRYQQNLVGRKIAIVVVQPSSNRLDRLSQHFPAVLSALEKIKPREIILVGSMN